MLRAADHLLHADFRRTLQACRSSLRDLLPQASTGHLLLPPRLPAQEPVATLELRTVASTQLLVLGWWTRIEAVAVLRGAPKLQTCAIRPHPELHRPSGAAEPLTPALLIDRSTTADS